MDARALLEEWPTFGKANAETLFLSPAWRMETVCDGAPAVLTRMPEPQSDILWLSVTLDDETHILGIGDAEAFHDLHLVWARRDALPKEMLLALVERDCGVLFQVLEKVFRRQFRLKSLAEGPFDEVPRRVDFRFIAENVSLSFALDVSPLLMTELGRLRNLDPSHEAIRALKRPAWTEYAAIELLESEGEALTAGDCLVLTEGSEPAWRVTVPEDDLVHVCDESVGEVTFAQMADDEWPALSEPGRVVLFASGRVVARGSLGKLGLQRVFKVEEVVSNV